MEGRSEERVAWITDSHGSKIHKKMRLEESKGDKRMRDGEDLGD